MKEIKLIDIINIFKLDLKLFISIIIIIDVIIVSYSLIMPQMFKSETSIMPPSSKSSGGGLSNFLQSIGGGSISLGGIMQDDETKIFEDILNSKTVAKKVIKDLQLDTLENFKDYSEFALINNISNLIDVKFEKSGILKLSGFISTPFFASEDEIEFSKVLAQKLTNSFAKALDETLREKNISSAKQSRKYIEDEIDKYRNKLDSVSIELQEFQEENNILEIDEQTKAVVTQAIEIGAQLIEYENELNLARIQLNPNSSQIKILEKQIEQIKQQAKRIQEGGLSNDKFSIPLSKVPYFVRKYSELYRDREILEKVLLYLETQRHQEVIQESKDIPVIELLDTAYIPETKVAPQRALMLIIGTIIAIIFASLYLIFRAYKKGAF